MKSIDHIALQVDNIKESVAWYVVNYGCKVLYRDDIVVEVKIVDLIDTKDKNRKEISNECYEIVKNNI